MESTGILPPLPIIPGIEIRHCPRNHGYAAGSDGSIWSVWTHRGQETTSWVLRPCHLNNRGRLVTSVRFRHAFAHALVAEAFHGPRPEGYDCRHLDGNPANNTASILAWGTRRENAQDQVRLGRTRRHKRTPFRKLKREQVLEIRALAATMNQSQIARRFSVSEACISLVVRRLSYPKI